VTFAGDGRAWKEPTREAEEATNLTAQPHKGSREEEVGIFQNPYNTANAICTLPLKLSLSTLLARTNLIANSHRHHSVCDTGKQQQIESINHKLNMSTHSFIWPTSTMN